MPFIDRVRVVLAEASAAERREWPAKVNFEPLLRQDAAAAIDAGKADLWVDARAGLMATLDAVDTAALAIYMSTVRSPRPAAREQFTALMEGVAEDARRRRIAAAGLPPSLLSPLRLDTVGQSPGQAVPVRKITGTVAGAVFVLLAVLTMTGAFYPAIDAIAGEKERGTIETLLIAPCSMQGVVLGKFLAVYAVTLATLAANVVSIAATSSVAIRVLRQASVQPLPFSTPAIAVAVAAFVGLAAVAAAASLAVTTASKSGKEAQNTLTPLVLLASALAGTALLPGTQVASPMAAAPFAGHVLVAHAAFGGNATEGAETVPLPLVPLAVSLAASAALAWLLLKVTALTLVDEDMLFRGADAAGHAFARPVSRPRPTFVQGVLPVLAGLAALWYSQGFMPADLVRALPLQQLAAVYLPLAIFTLWQRVALRRTFFVRPATVAAVVGAALIGVGVYTVGVAALAAFTGGRLSAGSGDFAGRLAALVGGQPGWLSWLVIAALPAFGEELLYRGWVLSAFLGNTESPRRVAAAIVGQAALFAVAHLMPERMPQTFVVGLVLGWVTVKTGSLLPAIVGHLVHNSMPLVVLAMFGGGRAGASTASFAAVPLWAVAGAVACVAAGVVAVRAGARQWRQM
jgi:sodium transport system permease protein